MNNRNVYMLSGGGGSALSGSSATLGLRLAIDATARACAEERVRLSRFFMCRNFGVADIDVPQAPRRALDSPQGKPCSVALLGLAFTMAEILLSLTIIGVVAAITLPSLTGNINERTWNTQRKALYARFSQALALMPSLNGYGTLTKDDEGNISDNAAETFVTEGLSKVLKINNICDAEHLTDCGIPDKITVKNSVISNFTTSYNTLVKYNSSFTSTWGYKTLDTKAAAFETQNGESILVYYNPGCVNNLGEMGYHGTTQKLCANFIYDLNGSKGPNTLGKDIGYMSALYPVDPVVVAPIPLDKTTGGTHFEAGTACQKLDKDSRVPNREELMSIFYNRLLGGTVYGMWWTSTLISDKTAWVVIMDGRLAPWERSVRQNITCVKR